MAPRRRETRGGARGGADALTIIGYGTTSCVVRRADGVAVKIVPNPADVERPEVLAKLLELDPTSEFFAVPRSVTVRPLTATEKETLELCVRTTPIRGSKVTSAVASATFVEMVDAGPTLAALTEPLKPGETRVIEVGTWPVRRVIETAMKVLAALGKLHAAGWVHGDLHVHNVAIGADGTARLLDFGKMKGIHVAGAEGVELDVKGYLAILGKLVTLADPQDDPAKFACLREVYIKARRGIGRLPTIADFAGCSAAEAAEAPVSPLRSGKRLFGVSPTGSPKTPTSASTSSPPAKVRRTPARGDDGAGPSTRRQLF